MTHTPQLTLTVDLPALARNYTMLAAKVGASVATAAAVKANAYGVGMDHVIQTLDLVKCPLYFVANVAEGIAARAVTQTKIAVLGGPLSPNDIALFTHHHLIPVINSPEQIEWVIAHAPTLPVILHIDTGMNRLGLSHGEAIRACADKTLTKLNILYVMSHFACSDVDGHALTHAQSVAFADGLGHIRTTTAREIPGSLCNSSGIFRSPAYHHQMVRPGYALYGGNPTPETINPMEQVVTLHTTILQVRDIAPAGQTVGYGATRTLNRPTRIATLAVGYADGIVRSLSNNGFMYVNGHACPVLGRVSMDLITIDLTDYPDHLPPVGTGSAVEIIGPHQNIDTLGAHMGTIGYEVLTQLSHRAARIYL